MNNIYIHTVNEEILGETHKYKGEKTYKSLDQKEFLKIKCLED